MISNYYNGKSAWELPLSQAASLRMVGIRFGSGIRRPLSVASAGTMLHFNWKQSDSHAENYLSVDNVMIIPISLKAYNKSYYIIQNNVYCVYACFINTFPFHKYDPPNLEGRSTNQTFLPSMLWLIWLPPNAGLPR